MKGIDWEKEQTKCLCEQWRDDDEELGIQIVKVLLHNMYIYIIYVYTSKMNICTIILLLLQDLHRTGSSLFSGPAGSLNQAKLKRVLIGYARWNPEVGYCQVECSVSMDMTSTLISHKNFRASICWAH